MEQAEFTRWIENGLPVRQLRNCYARQATPGAVG
jgi:hypothetical protein